MCESALHNFVSWVILALQVCTYFETSAIKSERMAQLTLASTQINTVSIHWHIP